jgi:hypothetical protein
MASRQTGVGSMESSKGNATADASIWLGTIAWVKHGRDTRADSCLLQERLLLDDASISKLVKKEASFLGFGYSIDDNLEPKLAWLQDRLSLDDKSLSKLVQAKPQVLYYSIEDNLEPTLSWLQKRLSLNDKSLCFVIQRMPSLLGLNIDKNLEPTIKFYEDCVGSNAAIQLIAKDPRILTASLENRLKPRLLECQEAGIPVDTGTMMRIAKYTELSWSNSMIFQKNNVLKEQLQGR